MRLIQSIILVSALFAFAGHSAAEPGQLHGSDSPEFQEAVEGWLAGDDLEALQELARLARKGNTASKMFLASIADRGPMHTHVTANLPRKERVALLRIPKDVLAN